MTILVIRHAREEGLGLLEKIFQDEKTSYQYLDVFVSPSVSVDLSKASALIVLGGTMGVYEADRYPFLAREIKLLKEAIRLRIPTLGICLGSQLLAAAMGARVYRGPQKEIGWFPVTTNPAASRDPLLKHFPSEVMAFHWHGDTFDLPQGAFHLASSERYLHQAFRIGDLAWGLQFHLEITQAMIQEWVNIANEKSRAEERNWNGAEILTQTRAFLPRLEVLAGNVFREFASLAKSSSAR